MKERRYNSDHLSQNNERQSEFTSVVYKKYTDYQLIILLTILL